MRKKTDAELRRSHVAKVTRTLIRLRHSLKADEDINRVLPDTLEEFDARLSDGELSDVVANLDDIIQP